jgi:hypothetical protein
MSANSVTLTAAGVYQLSGYYSTIIVANGGTTPAYVRTDGTAASSTGAAGDSMVPAGGTGIFGNDLAVEDADLPTLSPFSFGWTNQINRDTYAGGHGTNVSVYTAAGPVTIDVQ